MNRYATMAWEHYERFRPTELATFPNPQRWFAELGDMVAAEIDTETASRLRAITATDPTTMQMVRAEVEAEVLAELVFVAAEPTTTPPAATVTEAAASEVAALTTLLSLAATQPADDPIHPLLAEHPTSAATELLTRYQATMAAPVTIHPTSQH